MHVICVVATLAYHDDLARYVHAWKINLLLLQQQHSEEEEEEEEDDDDSKELHRSVHIIDTCMCMILKNR